MMTKIIFVNATAITEGGALTILKQFLEEINEYSDKNYIYYIFCSLDELKDYERENIKIINDIKAKKWLDRIKWDLWGLRNWSKEKGIWADLIISLQNTGVSYDKKVKQLVYLHQAIPFAENIHWHFFNKNERILWFYQNIYKKLIKYSLKKNSYIVVQTEWMKNTVIKQFGLDPSKVFVIKPNLVKISVEQIPTLDLKDGKYHLFYPAHSVIYKNHELIIKVLKYLKDNGNEVYNNLMVHFTIDSKSNNSRDVFIMNLIKKLGVSEHIKLEGKLSYEKVLSFYKSCDLMIFPSYLETLALPLIEAASFGLPILVADLPFAREVLGDYPGAKFLDYKDIKLWAENIIELYNKQIKYEPYHFNYQTSWKDFFELIRKLITEK